MYYIKFFLTWIAGVIIAGVGISLWKGESFDWQFMITLAVGGLIGVSIVMLGKRSKEKK
ncbi:hypothetical protein [Thalassobacillus hwangdonensis]|uniref:Uncharacterized protein n=1 Tax=Thalassobacillus hwangdonensis TaxID=546108 RepID=A0ABW3L3Z2_9BACI